MAERDYQRQKCYDWERATKLVVTLDKGDPDYLTLPQCKALAEKLWGARVVVKDGRGSRAASAYTYKRNATISLPVWSRSKEVIAHEMAHWRAKREGFEESAAHGAFFMGFYIEYLATLGYDKHLLTRSALSHGLRVKFLEVRKHG